MSELVPRLPRSKSLFSEMKSLIEMNEQLLVEAKVFKRATSIQVKGRSVSTTLHRNIFCNPSIDTGNLVGGGGKSKKKLRFQWKQNWEGGMTQEKGS